MKKILEWCLPLIFCMVFVYGRVVCYGPMNDSVAVQDTESYFTAAQADFPSLEFFEQQRSATVPLFYKLCNPTLEHEITLMSEPYFETSTRLAVQPGTENIIRTQTIISIVCWAACALLVCSTLNGWFAKALAALLILGFGFVPQIADWDSILSSESLSISLFALLVGLLIKAVPSGKKEQSVVSWILALLLFIVNALWIFTRDTNAYFVVLEAVLLIFTALYIWIREKGLWSSTIILGFCLIGLFFFQQQSFTESERWLLPLLNNLTANVFPYEERVAYFVEESGMPDDEETLALTGSAEYNDIYANETFMRWARRYGMKTYQKWLLSMPLWSVLQVYNNLESFFEENEQPFFYGSDQEKPHWASGTGDLLHPQSSAVILIDLLLLIALFVKFANTKAPTDLRWACCLLILFLGSGLLMSLSYLGEVRSIWRHVLGGVIGLRLTLWLTIAALFSVKDEKPKLNKPVEKPVEAVQE